MPGQYRVIVSFAGREIPKSPFQVGVEAASGDPTKVTASGPGIEKSGVVANRKTYFDVHTRSKRELICFIEHIQVRLNER